MLPPDDDTPPAGETPFALEPTSTGFESLGQENGFRYWWGSTLAGILGYESLASFRKAIERAMITFTTLNIPISDNIVQVPREVGGRTVQDYKLSRFACYLTAMNGDPRKAQVAQAQAYFVAWAQACECALEEADGVERVAIRAEISDHEKALSGVAFRAGVQNYALFQNAGYRGLYNMDLSRIRVRKGVPEGRSPLDFMGKTELAANLFRVTQTEDKIKADGTKGQAALERTAEVVGKAVRKTILDLGGKAPEALPPAEDIKAVHKKMKSSHRELKRLDKPKK